MRQLFLFIYNNRAFFVFVLLELLAGWIVVNQNKYQRVAFFTSANQVIGSIVSVKDDVLGYFNLREVNDRLATENARLKSRKNTNEISVDTVKLSSGMPMEYIPAKVINNSLFLTDNFLTINVGALHGVEEGMGVVSDDGVVGKVQAVSNHFSTVYSLLHSQMYVSGKLASTNTLTTVKWNGEDYRKSKANYLPLHMQIRPNDSIFTSGYNAVFPEDILIGLVDTAVKEPAESFLDVSVDLATDFSRLEYVYVVKNSLSAEKDSLEMENAVFQEGQRR